MRRSWIRTFCAAVIVVALATEGIGQEIGQLPEPDFSVPTERQQILVLKTFYYGMPIPDSIDRGILAAIEEGGANIADVFIENLDLARAPGSEHRAILAGLLRHKLAGKRFDVVIIEGMQAIDFIVGEGKDLFPDAVLITLIVPDLDPLSSGLRKVIDIPWRVDPEGTLNAALDLFPGTRRVVVVTGASDGILPFLDGAKKAFASWKDKLDFEYTNEMTYEEMLHRISTLPSDAIVIYSPFFTDTSGRSFVPADVVVKVSQVATVPVFATLAAFLGSGIVGGSLLQTETIGHEAGKAALNYLNGRIRLVEPVTTFYASTRMMFDWRELTRWKANIARLPGDSVLINRPLTLWEQYKATVLAAASVLLAMTFLSVTLLLLNRRLKRMTVVANESEARFRVMVERAPEAIIVYDIDLRRNVDANAKAEQLFGCNRVKLLRGGPERFHVPRQSDGEDVYEGIKNHNARAMAGEEVVFEQNIRSDDGRDLTCEIRLVRLPYRQQRLLRASFIDITDRKRAERLLAQNEARLRTLLQTIPDLVWLKDENGVYLACNRGFERFFGARESDIVGKTDYDFVDRALADFFREHDRKAIAAGKPSSNEEWVTFADDGHRALLDTIKMPMVDAEGKLAGVLGIARDITERKEVEERLQQAQKLESIGTLAGGIAHDFNNLLFPLLGFAELLKEDIPADSPMQSHIDEIIRAALRSKELVKQILTVGRKGGQNIQPIRLQPVVKEAMALLRSSIPTTIDIQNDIDPRCGMVMADPTQIHQIVMNLVTNAYHVMEASGGRLNVSLKQVEAALKPDPAALQELPSCSYALLTVSDTGPGIEKEILDKIFDPYFTTKGVGKGTGLGLSVVRGIVTSHNGVIDVSSVPGKGSKFSVYLPIMERTSKDIIAEDVGPDPVGTEKILLVDDELPIVRMEQQMLERLGYRVTSCTSSNDALEAFKADPGDFDLVLTDMTMPKITGIQLAKELASIQRDIPIIVCTGFSEMLNDERAKSSGIKGVLMKPVIKSNMAHMVRKVLDEAKGSAQG